MIPRLLFLLTTIFESARANGVSARFTKQYFLEKGIHQMVVFACWDSIERMDYCREVMKSDMKLAYIPISNDLDMKSILRVNYYKLGIVLDLDCPQGEDVLDKFSNDRLPYNESYFWLMVTKALTPPKDLLQQLPLTIETELTLATRWNDSYILYDIYNPSYRHGGRLNVTYMGHWNPEDGLEIELVQYKYKRRGNLHGLSLNFSIALTFPPVPDFMTYISNPIERHLDTMHRFNYALVLQLRDIYNFSMNILRSSSWGYLVNGSFNGMLGDMIAGLVDIGITPLQFKQERIDVAEFTVQAYKARSAIIFRNPKGNDVKNVFLTPFRDEVWWITLFVGIVYWLLLWSTVRIESYFNKETSIATLDSQPASESGLITVAAICQQGLTDGPGLYSGRMVFLSLFLWGLLLYQFYSASVVGSLLAESPRYINTLEDLLNSNLHVGIEDIAYNYDFFATTSDPIALELYKQKIAPNANRKKAAYYSAADGLRKVQRGGFAFQVDVVTAYKIILDTFDTDEICDLLEISLFPIKDVATVTSKHSPFKKMVTYGLRQVIECGMMERLRHVWQYQRPQCPDSHSSTPVPVSLKEFCPALFLLLMGLAIAVVVVLIEKYVKHRMRLSAKLMRATNLPVLRENSQLTVFLRD